MTRKHYCFWLRISALVIAAVDYTTSATKLRQLHVITRHGSRYPLIKNAANLSEVSQDKLTPTGEKQLYDLGLWLRDRYALSGMFDLFDPVAARLESSFHGRTIGSANALGLGLFDEAARDPGHENKLPFLVRPNVPVYTTELINDVVLKAYDKCNTYHDRLEQLYSSTEFRALQQEYSTLLTTLAQIPEFAQYKDDATNMVLVQDVWNVFDLVKVAKTECVNATAPTPTCLDVPDVKDVLSDAEWSDLQTVAFQAELYKYSNETAGGLIGGNLLQRVTERMTVEDYPHFYLYSAHYPTILGVFAALGLDPAEDEVIPAYGTALIFELNHDPLSTQGEDDLIVNIFYKPGGSENATKLGYVFTSTLDCPLSDLVRYLESNGIAGEDWCTECDNDTADVCLAAKKTSSPASSNQESCPDKAFSTGGAVGLGVATGVVTGLGVFLVLMWQQKRRKGRNTTSSNQDEAGNSSTPGNMADVMA
jgi:Histidine phosphatase superfamily (branch 2)